MITATIRMMIRTRIKAELMSIISLLSMLVIASLGCAAQADASTKENRQYCEQRREIRESLIRQAQAEEYNVKLVQFLGADHIPGRDIFKRVRTVNEGDIFTRDNLEKAIRSLSGFGRIRPVSMDSVIVKLAEEDRSINILFCVTERIKKRPTFRRPSPAS